MFTIYANFRRSERNTKLIRSKISALYVQTAMLSFTRAETHR